jgi:hypothetical protein
MKKNKDRTAVKWEPYEANPQVFDSDDPRGLVYFIRKLAQDYSGPSGPNCWIINREHAQALNIAMDLLPLSDALTQDIVTILQLLEINESIKLSVKY